VLFPGRCIRDLATVVTFSRPESKSSGNFVLIQKALSRCSALAPRDTSFPRLSARNPVRAIAEMARTMCRTKFIAAECASAAMNGAFSDLLNNRLTYRRH
jgi:hypothetical protein